jgi:hypothetical protein
MANINDIFQKELQQRREENIFAPAENQPTREDIPDGAVLPNISIDETTEEALLNAEYGPQQVESLLGLVVDFYLGKRLDDAADDVDAVRHLNRIKYRGG